MRLVHLLSLLSIIALALAWTKEDHEIFDLVSALEAAEGTTFYTHLGVDSAASQSEITKAYRKKSLELHPDKNPGVKNIQERFARLGVIAQILRSPEGRERYNFFHKNGVPIWRGTGYYYSRYRPTLSHTLLFLVLLTTGFHRLVLQLNYARDRERVEYFERAARSAAGVKVISGAVGPEISPASSAASPNIASSSAVGGSGRASGTASPSLRQGAEIGNAAANGNGNGTASGGKAIRRRKVKVPMVEGRDQAGFLDLVVVGEDVYLPSSEVDIPLSTLAVLPSFHRTWPVTLSLTILRSISTRLPPSLRLFLPSSLRAEHASPDDDGGDEDDSDPSRPSTPRPGSGSGSGPTPAGARKGSRVKEMRDARKKGASAKGGQGGGAESPATTELESGTEDEGTPEGAGEGESAEARKKRRAGGKSLGARRRKMGMKK